MKTTGIKIVTGGPGTGKTTIIKKIITEYERIYPENSISLCAPTGRAAQRMEESTRRPASTIHSLIDYKPFGQGKEISHKDYEKPIESDLIIVDEMSMTDIVLMAMLVGAIRTNTLLVLVGDVNQLPSVGPGNVLKDLIQSQRLLQNKGNVKSIRISLAEINEEYVKMLQAEEELFS